MPDEEGNRAKLETIIQMVKRLKHARDCSGGEDCELTDKEILGGLNIFYEDGMKASEKDRKIYHDEDEARLSIEEDPLSVEVRSGWHSPGEKAEDSEYIILLVTGGPALRIRGELDRQEPRSAKLEYQDWFTPWEIYHTEEEEYEALLAYARCFYFG